MSPCGGFLSLCPVPWKQCRLSTTGQACIYMADSLTLPQSRAKTQVVFLSWRCFPLSYQKSHESRNFKTCKKFRFTFCFLRPFQNMSKCSKSEHTVHTAVLGRHLFWHGPFWVFFLQTGRTPSTRINIQAIKQVAMLTSGGPNVGSCSSCFPTLISCKVYKENCDVCFILSFRSRLLHH